MAFIADLHIHSRHSMATSRDLGVPQLCSWAAVKGIRALGTGDFVHPGWRAELKEFLEPDDASGLLRLKPEYARLVNRPCGTSLPLFCLQAEISCVYKRHGKTRKVHNLVYLPDMEAAERLSASLGKIGNIAADGRPILKLDSRDLLEMTLEAAPGAVLAPAHIWTPWYSLLGQKSGFDSIEECYGDLTRHVFMLETGLSSDPAMNRLVSAHDGYALFSNSDAHSGQNLGREANLFSGEPSYRGIFEAFAAAARREPRDDSECAFLGTVEFFPEEGKYYQDGHRNCGVSLTPAESRELGNLCPVCGKPLTTGVLHRIHDLADRTEEPKLENEPEAALLVPLQTILAEILGTSPASVKARREYSRTVENLGPELDVLHNIPVSDVFDWWEPLGEAVSRVRSGRISVTPGFDGQYGIIRIFEPSELAQFGKTR